MATPTSLPATFTSGQVLTAAQMNNLRGAFRILQVVSTAETDTFSASVASGGVSGAAIEATITPTSADSKILVIAHISIGAVSNGVAVLYRGGSVLSGAVGDAASSRSQGTSGTGEQATGGRIIPSAPIIFLDSPATTSATTYDVRLGHTSGTTQTVYLNRGDTDADAAYTWRGMSDLTLLEVSA